MSSQLGPIEIDCDAPPYPVVKACERLGFHSPLDVRWCRISHFLPNCGERGHGGGISLWMWLLSKIRPQDITCTCGVPLPILDWYTFTFLSGKDLTYHLGQCSRCRTIFWEEGETLGREVTEDE